MDNAFFTENIKKPVSSISFATKIYIPRKEIASYIILRLGFIYEVKLFNLQVFCFTSPESFFNQKTLVERKPLLSIHCILMLFSNTLYFLPSSHLNKTLIRSKRSLIRTKDHFLLLQKIEFIFHYNDFEWFTQRIKILLSLKIYTPHFLFSFAPLQ